MLEMVNSEAGIGILHARHLSVIKYVYKTLFDI